MVWRYAYCFFQNPEIIFYHIYFIFNLDFFRALILQKCIGSLYLVRAIPPTFSGQSFWNFTGAFRMVWRYAYCFFQNPEIIFITFFAFLTYLDFFRALILQKCIGSMYLVHAIPQADPFETLLTLLGWSEDMHIVFFFQNPEIIFYHLLLHFYLRLFGVYCFSSCLT